MSARTLQMDPVELSLFKHAFHAIAEEMGATLRRTAYSPNIKERRDYSCAVFTGAGEVIAMGDHMPVHLGSMPLSVATAIAAIDFGPGDIAVLNDPYGGGTHLPDITMVMPVFLAMTKAGSRKSAAKPAFYVAARAHHADVGGMYPGSMGPCREIFQEGLRIPPIKIAHAGELDRNVLALILYNVRTPLEREGDLTAQIGACRVGAARLQELAEKYGMPRVASAAQHLMDYTERLLRAELAKLPAGTFAAEDFLDDDGITDAPVKIAVSIRIDPKRSAIHFDFTGTSPQVTGSINAVYAITYSAIYYVLRCLLPDNTPATAGLMRPVTLNAPEGTVINAISPAAVAGGNVETSQRIVDTLLKALAKAAPQRVPAASSGTMNNLTIGGTGHDGKPFAYYETIAGGMGARPGLDGISGTHTHLTNSLNTPAEAIEYAYPFRVREYSLRRGSGGAGTFRGGDGIVREVELLTDAQVTLLTDRRRFAPYGLSGGDSGQTGRTLLISTDGTTRELPGKCSVEARRGDRVRMETPGGGGWGKAFPL